MLYLMDVHTIKAFLAEHVPFIQVLLFAGIIIFLWIIEKLLLAEPVDDKWRHTSTNLLVACSALSVQLMAGLLLIPLSSWVTAHRWGLIYYLPDASSPWIKYVLMLLLLDFLDYAYHRGAHSIPAFWKLHLVHHTDQTVDVSTTVREHPGETALRNAFLIVWVFVLGASSGVLILRQTLQTASNIFSHTSIHLPPRISRISGWVLMTPHLHRTHHHFKLPYTDRNYGDILSIWDRIFGTFAVLPAKDIIFGLDTHMDEVINGSYVRLMTMPFCKPRRILHPQWVALVLCVLFIASPVQAQAQDFTYRIMHPLYGDIGTFTERIVKNPNDTQIDIHVNIAVSILGITVYRQKGDRTELFHGNRFVSLHSSTITNGDRLDVRGEVKGDHFVITSSSRVTNAAINIFPSDPWMVKSPGVGTSVAIETGDVLTTHITGGEPAPVSVQGTTVMTHHFIASGEDQHYDVWLNDRNVPVMFRSVEDGTPIDFILTTPVREVAHIDSQLAPVASLRPENSNVLSGSL